MMRSRRGKIWLPILLITLNLILLVVLVTAFYYFILPQSIKAVTVSQDKAAPIDEIIQIDFSRPINRKTLKPDISPALAGSWQFSNMLIGRHLAMSVSFVPDTVLQPETEYSVSLMEADNILATGQSIDYQFSFITDSLPKVADVIPATGTTELLPQTEIKITLDKSLSTPTEWSFSSEPEFEYKLVARDNLVRIVPDGDLAQGTKYQWQLERTLLGTSRTTGKVIERFPTEEVSNGSFSILPPPDLSAVEPTGDQVFVDQSIDLTFTRLMDQVSAESGFSITPEVKGVFSWNEDSTRMTFTPSANLLYDTDFTVKMAANTRDQSGGFLLEDSSYKFTTIGPVEVIAFKPSSGATGVAIDSTIRAGFDQAIDKPSAESKFSISPEVAGAFSWDGKTIEFTPSQALSYSTNYVISFDAGIASINGQPSQQSYSASFTTRPKTTQLDIALDYQDRPLSCEAAALKMALNYKGASVSETDIMNIIGYDPSPRRGNVWGDPESVFVGDINGRQNSTGYGVHRQPILKAALHWRPSETFSDWSTEQILKKIEAGNPVVIWGIYPGGYSDPWQTEAGKPIAAWKGEHTRTIIGFVGPASDPEQIILNDPISGRLYWSRAAFEANIATFNNSGVVVR
ncbi:MAG: Ig-like domain-containing protein [Patescibacteria group bacterium]